MTPQRLVLASGNAGKLREIRAWLAPLGIETIAQSELGVHDADEPHPTFIENCLAKARHAARLTGLPVLADDSGLCVPALGGAPGVHSSRYANETDPALRDARNNRRLLEALAGIEDRRAWFYCVMVWLRHADDPQPLIGEGLWHGTLLLHPAGDEGFGYDPLFFLPQQGVTAAQLPLEEKNRLSHRAQALRSLGEKLAVR